ncbi:MAG: GNAT family N-acetyltransferase [Acidobacteria bacterium]|nr:GNAT family N-acetyltransferase [Acidobacteriota bacterium]
MLHPTTASINETPRHDIAAYVMSSPDLSKVHELTTDNTAEVQAFLSIRPVHTVVMSSFIVDNGIESELNRGKFYGYRNEVGTLEGVALIGHSTLVEARSDEALRALATVARTSETPIHLIMSSGTAAEDFWQHMTNGLTQPRLKCTEALFDVAFPFAVKTTKHQLKNADMSHLIAVAEAQAEVAFIECGVDPMLKDREGFLKRVARRIEQNRVFVVTDGDELVFKADIIAETSEVIYLEGVYVSEKYRGQGIGSECLSALTLRLLDRAEHICMLSNVDFTGAHKSFVKAGFRNTDHCTTLFV